MTLPLNMQQALFTVPELDGYNNSDTLPFQCKLCTNIFFIEKKWIKVYLKQNILRNVFCSRKCDIASRPPKEWFRYIDCAQCKINVKTTSRALRKSKSGNIFCSRSCAAKYNNTHKTTGTRRSKLEVWLEEQLTATYPNLEILFNKKESINSELDIYIPSLKLAVELNGIFHYEPIFGSEKLDSIQNNDERKFQACLERNIELIIIDVSTFLKFKEAKAIKYLDIIKNIISIKLNN